jgi:tRNA 5-methylaminomethyl-2-thiouridine biosynthesis bifunctional protein
MIKTETNALDLQYVANKWQVRDQKCLVAEAPVVILATANDTLSFEQTHHCTLLPVRGQTTLLPSNESSAAIKSAICTDGYITPESNGFHCLGASFLPGDTSIEIRASEHQSNLTLLKNLAPSIQTKTAETMTGRAAIRCTTADYLPMAGIVLNAETLESNPPRPSDSENSLVQLSGLYINTGHGSKGLVNAPLCAEIIASLINQEPLPVSQKLAGALNPNRFLLRKMGLKKLASALIKPLS